MIHAWIYSPREENYLMVECWRPPHDQYTLWSYIGYYLWKCSSPGIYDILIAQPHKEKGESV